MARHRGGGSASQAERYKRAALNALALVDWCIEYLENNSQRRIALRLARNRRRIGDRLSN
jgi:hypothetical protein